MLFYWMKVYLRTSIKRKSRSRAFHFKMKTSLCAILAFILFFGDFTAALPQLTKITNGTLSNVTIASQRTYKSYGQAVIDLVHAMKVDMAYFVLSKREQVCLYIWKALAAEKSLKAKFFIVGDPRLNSSILPVDEKTTKRQCTMITNVQGSQMEDIVELTTVTSFERWSFIIIGDRVPVKEFRPYAYYLPPVICTQFEYDQNQMFKNRNKSITFFDYQHDLARNQAILIPLASWKNGVLRWRRMTSSKEAVGIFLGRTTAIWSFYNPPAAGYGPNYKADTFATQMFQNLNEFFGNRIIVQDNTKPIEPMNCAVHTGMMYYGFTTKARLSTKIPTMGKFCIGFVFLKAPVYPTADIFVNPLPNDIWLIVFFLILTGHVLLKFQVWLQMTCRQSARKVGIQEWFFLDVDEDLRLARSLGIPMLSVKLIVLLVIVISFIFSMIYSTMFASALTNMKDTDIPYHTVGEFYKKWHQSSICYTSYYALAPVLFQKKGVDNGKDGMAGNFFVKLLRTDSTNLVYDLQGAPITKYANESEQKECYIDFMDSLQYIFQRRCNYGKPTDVILCMDIAPLAFTTWFPFIELYQNALLRLKETGIATRLRQQFSTEYKDCSHVSLLKPIQLSVTQYILAICFIGCLAAVLVLIVERAVYQKPEHN